MSKNSLPIIEFRTSWIYNVQWIRPKKLQKPPDLQDWVKREKKLRLLWAMDGRKILRTMSRVTGLPWREDRIIVYLSWGIRPFSDPLTLNLRADVQAVFDTLAHELIHRICSHEKNHQRIRRRWRSFVKQYPNELPLAINHVPIHAVHERMWRELFPRRLKKIKSQLTLQPYIRAWQIVDEQGAELVVKKIFGA